MADPNTQMYQLFLKVCTQSDHFSKISRKLFYATVKDLKRISKEKVPISKLVAKEWVCFFILNFQAFPNNELSETAIQTWLLYSIAIFFRVKIGNYDTLTLIRLK